MKNHPTLSEPRSTRLEQKMSNSNKQITMKMFAKKFFLTFYKSVHHYDYQRIMLS